MRNQNADPADYDRASSVAGETADSQQQSEAADGTADSQRRSEAAGGAAGLAALGSSWQNINQTPNKVIQARTRSDDQVSRQARPRVIQKRRRDEIPKIRKIPLTYEQVLIQ